MRLTKAAPSRKDVFIEALSLPGKPRAALAHQLLVSLDAEKDSPKQLRSPKRRNADERKMSNIAQQICAKTLRLSFPVREELARLLLLSIEEDDYDDNSDELWRKEIARRLRDIRSGRAKLIPAEEVMRRTALICAKPS